MKVKNLAKLIKGIESVQDTRVLRQVTTSFVVVQSGVDKYFNPTGARLFYNSASAVDKQIWWYPESWHYILKEPEADEVMQRSVEWILERC